LIGGRVVAPVIKSLRTDVGAGGRAILEVENLRTSFDTERGVLRAVDGVSFTVGAKERVAIVGESGSGKSVMALSIMRLLMGTSGRVLEGSRVCFEGVDLAELKERDLRRVRGGKIGMVFQDPMSSLNPLLSIGSQLQEAVRLHRSVSKRVALDVAKDLLGEMGIPNPVRALKAYPHEFSGGMRQRAMIAMALCGEPDLLIADEPTTALDATIQAQIMELLVRLVRERDLAVLLITHDLGLVAGFAQRVFVMYSGRLVETASTEELYNSTLHPYTAALLRSVPSVKGEGPKGGFYSIQGAPPSLLSPPSGCRFHPRCEFAGPRCQAVEPQLEMRKGWTHQAACHFGGDLNLQSWLDDGDRPAVRDAEQRLAR
jgi:oligopeptide/dipeptide ABC transporter ATP-binding protein